MVANDIVGGNSKAVIEITDFEVGSDRALYEPLPFDMILD